MKGSPGINAGRGLKHCAAGERSAPEMGSPGINAGRGLKLVAYGGVHTLTWGSPGINAGRGLKLYQRTLHDFQVNGIARY